MPVKLTLSQRPVRMSSWRVMLARYAVTYSPASCLSRTAAGRGQAVHTVHAGIPARSQNNSGRIREQNKEIRGSGIISI